jgi:hypothetical protein
MKLVTDLRLKSLSLQRMDVCLNANLYKVYGLARKHRYVPTVVLFVVSSSQSATILMSHLL